MAEEFIKSIVGALTDLIKSVVMNAINTGDKVRDNYLIAVFMVLITYISGTLIDGKLMKLYKKLQISFIHSLNTANAKLINEYFRDVIFDTNYSVVYVRENNLLKQKVATLFTHLYLDCQVVKLTKDLAIAGQDELSYSTTYDFLKRKSDEYNRWDDSKGVNKKPWYRFVVYMDRHGYVFVYYGAQTGTIKLLASSVKTMDKFIEYLKTVKVTGVSLISNEDLKIYDESNSGPNESCVVSSLPKYRNMGIYVSRHKKKIITMLDKFLSTNVSLGGYGSLNLGIMLHGEPGTGKTLLMKAIANYLNRSIRIIDMRNIKTRKQFVQLFADTTDDTKNYKKLIYVLDEFDCVKGIISNRSENEEENKASNKNESKIQELKKRYLQILQIKPDSSSSKNIDDELAKINKEIAELENALTLDTMLTVLDGVVEHSGRVIIAATNYIDKIDPALIREGRFDIKIKLEKFNEEETKELLSVMFHDAPAKDLARLAKVKLASNIYTPAQLVNMASESETLANMLSKISDSEMLIEDC